MKINLAGHTVDVDTLKDALDHGTVDHATVNPESIPAAYARISRSPKPVGVLRAEAAQDVEKARKTNEAVVFGMSHCSIAEHAVFNFDIMDVSRLAIEAIEHSRLVSYTERSQRYLQLKGTEEVHVPVEVPKDDRDLFVLLMAEQMQAYQELYAGLSAYFLKAHSEGYRGGKPTGKQVLTYDGKAKEDARYVTPLAVMGQLGMTISARNLETMIRRLVSHPLEEVQSIGRELHRITLPVAPSLLRYCAPEPIRQLHTARIPKYVACRGYAGAVRILKQDGGGSSDERVLSALMFQYSQAPYSVCEAATTQATEKDRWRTFCEIYDRMEMHSAAPRAFEIPDVVCEMVGSASFFAQLKRHRMATILPQDYDVSLGCTVPGTIMNAGLQDVFAVVREETERIYDLLRHRVGRTVAEYALMQAHRRRVLVKMNARQLYAFSRLREDSHAQWEIREVAHTLILRAREVMPMTLALACGKDEFDKLKARVLSSEGGVYSG